MSLLMDALKRAEEAKRAAEESPAATPHGQALSAPEVLPGSNPVTPTVAPQENSDRTSRLPDLAAHIDSVDAELASATASQMNGRPTAFQPTARRSELPRGSAERATAQNVFSAKHPVPRKPATALIVGLGIVGAIVVGAYFWWQLAQLAPQSAPAKVGEATSTPPPAMASPSQSGAHTEPDSPRAPTPELRSQNHPDAASGVGGSDPVPSARPSFSDTSASAATSTSANTQTERASSSLHPAKPEPLAAKAELAPENTLRFARQTVKPMPQLDEAYDALLAGRLDDARRGYERVLKFDSRNVDALLGMATIASRQNATEVAHTYYARAFEADPTNATAMAGLVEATSQGDSASAESELKSALAMQPDSAALLVALGNLFAREERWADAQEAYFRAHTVDSGNADIIINLAVSLDHLHQKQLARQFYQKALEAAAGPPSRSVSFNVDQVRQRLNELAQ